MMAELLERDQMYTPLWQQLGNNRNIHRLAGLSGALAVIFAAVGAHGSISDGHKEVFRNGNLMHFFHTIVLLAMPMARSPYLSSLLFTIGMLFFSGGCYVKAFTGSSAIGFINPIGGVILILGWMSLMF